MKCMSARASPMVAAVLLMLPSSAAAVSRRIPAGAVIRLADRGKGPATEPVRPPGRFSPDGRTFAFIDKDGFLRVYGLPADGPVYIKELARNRERGAVYSPDGRNLMLVDSDGYLRVAALPEGRDLVKLGVRDLDIGCATFSPRSDFLGVTRREAAGIISHLGRKVRVYDYAVEIWRLSTGERVLRIEASETGGRPAVFTPDGRGIAAIGKDDRLRVWELATGEVELSVADAEGGCFSPDGRMAFVVDEEGVISVWDLATWRIADGRVEDVTSMSVSPDGRFLALKMDDESIRIVDAATGAQCYRFLEPAHGELALEPKAGTNWLRGRQTPAWDMVFE